MTEHGSHRFFRHMPYAEIGLQRSLSMAGFFTAVVYLSCGWVIVISAVAEDLG